jgi:hypothetical protein
MTPEVRMRRAYKIPLGLLTLAVAGCETDPPPPIIEDPLVGDWSITTKAGDPNPNTVLDVAFGEGNCDVVYNIESMRIKDDLTGLLDGAFTLENCFPEGTMSGTSVPYTLNVLATPRDANRYEISIGANTQFAATLQLELSGDALSGLDETDAVWSFTRVEE